MHHTMPCQTAIRSSSDTHEPGHVPLSGLGTALRCSSGTLAPAPSRFLARAPLSGAAQGRLLLSHPGFWPGHRAQSACCRSKKAPVTGAFVCSFLGQVPGMVSSSGHVPEAACGLRSMSGGRAYQSALLRVNRVISAGTSMRQEKPDQMPVPLLTYR